MHLFTRPLAELLASRPLPEGFHVRASRGAEDAERRSAASHAAFGSSMPFDEYWQRTLRFVQSPVYVKEHELFVTAPDERVAAFCCIWTDSLNRMGYFEPVGVHPDFHRRGLGKYLLFEGLRRLRAEGMTAASVCAESDNPAAIHLYESAGFQKVKRLLTFQKGKTS
jgi:ribosomal protein S18 acetylase RimI-like enzyme